MKILLDARFYGLENTGIGRYTMNLLSEISKLDKTNNYVVLLRKKYYESLKLPGNFHKVLADTPHYSFKEQLGLSSIIKKENPDLVHFLHFNVPINYKGSFIVTIHDMTMHNQKTRSSNLLLPIYFAKHYAYKQVFKHAVLKSQKILVPSQYVKDQLLGYFKIPKDKVIVTYEGI